MLLEIGLFKKKKKERKKKRNQDYIKSGLSQSLFLKKDVICCSNGYIYHFLDYIIKVTDYNNNNNNNNNNNSNKQN